MAEIYFFSAKSLSFYPASMKEMYDKAGQWPSDAVQVSNAVFQSFSTLKPGKTRGATDDGKPCWIDLPPLKKEEEIVIAESNKNSLIDEANYLINSRQWPGKAALGRLTDDEKNHYILWLDYLDAVNAVDTSLAPKIKWPAKPKLE